MEFSRSVEMFEGRLPQGATVAGTAFPLVRSADEIGSIDLEATVSRVPRPPRPTRPVTTRSEVIRTEHGAIVRVLVGSQVLGALEEMSMPEGGLRARVIAQASLESDVTMAAPRPPRPSPPVTTILRAVHVDQGGMLDIELPDDVVSGLDDLGRSEEIVIQLLRDDDPAP